MSKLFTRLITVHDLDDEPTPALLQVCECGGTTWLVYAIRVGHREHPHMQCTDCGASYCDGRCSVERPVFACPKCGRVSHHADDVRTGYCGACHEFTGEFVGP